MIGIQKTAENVPALEQKHRGIYTATPSVALKQSRLQQDSIARTDCLRLNA